MNHQYSGVSFRRDRSLLQGGLAWSKGGHEWMIEAPNGTLIAEAHWKWLEIPRDTYHIKIHSNAIDPYFVLATVFSNTADANVRLRIYPISKLKNNGHPENVAGWNSDWFSWPKTFDPSPFGLVLRSFLWELKPSYHDQIGG
jgi:hypothetical protein